MSFLELATRHWADTKANLIAAQKLCVSYKNVHKNRALKSTFQHLEQACQQANASKDITTFDPVSSVDVKVFEGMLTFYTRMERLLI